MINSNYDKRYSELANILVNYSIKNQFKDKNLTGKNIGIFGEIITEPLMLEVEKSIINSGGNGVLNPFFSSQNRKFYSSFNTLKYGTDEQIKFIPDFYKQMFNELDAFIYILGSDEINKFSQLKFEKRNLASKEFKDLLELRVGKAWNLCLFPTKSDAKFEELEYEEYKNFVLNSSIINYKKQEESQEKLKILFENSKEIKVRTFNPNTNKLLQLEMNKANHYGVKCHGLRNICDGEVYTSPIIDSLEGEVYLDIPVFQENTLIEGIYLKFKKGKIVKFSAKKGEKTLENIINTDKDSCRIGEFALGTNEGLTRNLKHPLFAEKIGGTFHMAIGTSYTKAMPYFDNLNLNEIKNKREELSKKGIFSNSSIHIDIPKDMRNPKKGEEIIIGNNKVIWNKNKWIIE